MQQRPFTLLGGDLLAAVQGLLAEALRGWSADWGVAGEEVLLECRRAWECERLLPATPQWRQPWSAGDSSLALAWPADLLPQLQRLLFGAERSYGAGVPHTAQAAAETAWLDLQQRLALALLAGGAPAGAPTPPSAAVWRPASGALLVQLQLGRHSAQLVMNHAAVQLLSAQLVARGVLARPAAAPLAPVDLSALLAQQPVRLPVALGRAEVDLGSLVRLQVGDVIRLDRAADRALPVHGPSGAALFDGYLGRSDAVMALELLAHDSNDGVKHEQ